MGTDNGRHPEADPGIREEQRKIEDLNSCLEALNILQGAFASLASALEQRAAEGRRCILAVTGLRYHEPMNFFFEVKGSQIARVPPFERYTTYIAAPIDSVIRVLKGVLSGDEQAFEKEWARGLAQIRGTHSLHDGVQFAEGFKRLARIVKRYRSLANAGRERGQ